MANKRELRTVLGQRILDRRLSLEECAEQLELFAREHNEPGTLGLRHLQRLAAGEFIPDKLRTATIRLLERFFLASIDELLTPLRRTIEPPPLVTHTDEQRQADVLARPVGVDLVAVAALRQRLHDLNAAYDQQASTSLLGAAGQYHADVTVLSARAHQAKVRHELWRLHAESSIFMGQLVWDASQRKDHDTARTYFDDAITAAQMVNDPAIAAYAALRQSYLALYGERNPVAGVGLAQQAADLARPVSPALTGLGLLHVAEASAMLGERQSCESALGQAEEQLARIDDTDIAGEYLSLNEVWRMSGSCYLFLRLPGKAEAILEGAVKALARKKKAQSIVLGNLSLAHIRQNKLDEATASLHSAIDALEGTRGGGGLSVAFAAGRELRQWHNEPAVNDVNDRLLSLVAAS
jgi:hypothetical protein